MTDDTYRVEMIGHATLRVQYGGRTLVTDPWLVGPIGCGSCFHFPPLVHDPDTVLAQADAIWLSHVHPDHFNPATLARCPREVPVYIGRHRRSDFRDAVARLGLRVVEVPFGEPLRLPESEIEITILEHDYEETAAFDSALIVRTPSFTLFENNDCYLRRAKYDWVRERFAIDYAFLGYSPASFYPICFEMPADEKARLLADASERRYGDFLDAATWLSPRIALPFASDLRFFVESALWKNVVFNSAPEAARRWRARGGWAEVMGPGDRIAADGTFERVSVPREKADELAAIAAHAAAVQDWVLGFERAQPPPPADLVERFRRHLLDLFRLTRDVLPGVARHVIAYRLLEPAQAFYFDFSRPDGEIFQWGEPAHYDMRYTYPAEGLRQVLDGEIDWDVLHFTTHVSVHQVRYAKDFYAMLRTHLLDLS